MRHTTLTLLLLATTLLCRGRDLTIAYYDTSGVGEEGVVQVLDSMKLQLVALFGVETKDEVESIVERSGEEYSYIHRTLDYYDGRDFALLYDGSTIFIEQIETNGYWLYALLEVDGESIGLHLTRRGDRVRTTLPPHSNDPTDHTILCGVLSRNDIKRLKMYDPLRESERRGYGNLKGERSWQMASRIGVSEQSRGGVYITEWLLQRLHHGERLPIYVTLSLEEP